MNIVDALQPPVRTRPSPRREALVEAPEWPLATHAPTTPPVPSTALPRRSPRSHGTPWLRDVALPEPLTEELVSAPLTPPSHSAPPRPDIPDYTPRLAAIPPSLPPRHPRVGYAADLPDLSLPEEAPDHASAEDGEHWAASGEALLEEAEPLPDEGTLETATERVRRPRGLPWWAIAFPAVMFGGAFAVAGLLLTSL